MGMGIIIKDSNGEVVASLCAPRRSENSAFLAECYAMRRLMNHAMNWDQAGNLRGDAKIVLDAMQSKENEVGPLTSMAKDTKKANSWEEKKKWGS